MNSPKLILVGKILSGVMAAFFAFNAMVKLFPDVLYPEIATQMEGIGLPASILPVLAMLELLCVIVYSIPKTSVLGAVLFTGYLGGAILTHLRVGQNVFIQISFGLLIWLGIYLREPRLHAILPFRK